MRVEISTADDPRVSSYRAIREPEIATRENTFVVEGRQAVERLVVAASQDIHSILLTETARGAMAGILRAVPASVPIYVTSLSTLFDIAGFQMHRGCVALAYRPAARVIEQVLADARTLFVLQAVGNPDNIGAMFRVGQALGADGVLLGRGCADPLYRKAIRTSGAATLALPYAHFDEWAAVAEALRAWGFTLVALTPQADATSLHAPAVTAAIGERLALLVGAEGTGLTREAIDGAHLRLRVPMRKGTDSLNLATAAAIALSYLRPVREE